MRDLRSLTAFSFRLISLTVGVFLLIHGSAHAQRTTPGTLAAEKRVALVIGNNDYKTVPRLERAVADARVMGAELGRLGFEVISRSNLDRRGMNLAVSELVDKVSGGGVGVLFFAGHGVQISGSNFLLPVDVKVGRADDLTDEAIDLGRVMERLSIAKAKFTLMIVDACRDNPFPRVAGRSIGGSRGLSIPSAPDGLMVVYSAGINEQALDKLDERDRNPNGLFTREFVKQLRQPGIRVDDMLRRVRNSVREQAQSVGHVQNPAIYDQSNGDFYFVLPQGAAQVASIAPASQGPDPATVELTFWDAVKDSKNPAEIQTYLDQYPQGQFASLAKVRIGLLAPIAPKPPVPDAANERAFWDSVKDSKNPEEMRAYLKQFPNGLFTSLAEARLKGLQSTQVASLATASEIARSLAPVVNAALMSEVVGFIDKNYYVLPDFRALVRGAAKGLENGPFKGKFTVAEEADRLMVTIPNRGTPVAFGRASSISEAQQQLVQLGNLANESDTSVGATRIEETLLRGGLAALDMHSDFLSREAFKEMQVGISGQFGGLGLEVGIRDGWTYVVTPISDTPAARAGLRTGDRIVSVDGFVTRDVALNDVIKRMRGAPGSRVLLGVQREGWDTPRDIAVTREIIRIQSVQSRIVDPRIGYVRISQFQQATPQALQAVLDGWAGGFLRSASVDALVLDLRNNPGGLLSSGLEVVEKFVPSGQLAATMDSRIAGARQTFRTKSSGSQLDVPMVVLTNEGTASVSELLAGILQDTNRAVILGAKTFGKGTVQTIAPLTGGYALKLSTAEQKTPKGRGFHETGLQPDMVVPGKMPAPGEAGEDVQLQTAIARLKQSVGTKK